MKEKTLEVTIRATVWQISSWGSMADWMKRGDLPEYVPFATDLCTRYLRELYYRRSIPDSIRRRQTEKAVLRRLLDAAKVATQYLPAHVVPPIGAPIFVGRDLKHAIQGVQEFLQETGEEYTE